MALFTDDFTGTNADPVRSRTGWSGVGSSGVQNNIQIQSNACRCGGGSGWDYVVKHDTGANNHRVKATLKTASVVTHLYARLTDYGNGVGLGSYGANAWELIKVVGGTKTRIVASSLTGAGSVDNEYELQIIDGRAYCYLNGSPIGDGGGYDISDVTASSSAGFSLREQTASWDDFEAESLVTDTMSITAAPAANAVLQRPAGGGDFELTLSGTYAGAEPDHIQWRLEDGSGGLKTGYDWSTVGGATIADGDWSATVDIPPDADRDRYIVKLRTRDIGNTVIAEAQSLAFTVGDVWIGVGQSNMVGLFGSGEGEAGAGGCAIFDPGTGDWSTSSARIGHFLNGLADLVGVPQGIAAGLGENSTSIRYHAPAHTSTEGSVDEGANWPNIEDAVLALGDCAGELRVIGENDAGGALTKQQQKDAFDAIRSAFKTLTGRSDGQFTTLVMVTGRNDGGAGTDANWQAVREAQAEWCAATTGAYVAGDCISLSMADSLHYDSAGYVEMARRFARTAAFVAGDSAYDGRGPIIAGATIVGDEVTVHFDLNGSSTLSGTGPLDGWEYYDGSWNAATDADVDGNTVVFTGADATQVRYLYGADPDVADIVRGDVKADGASAANLPAEPTRGAVVVAVYTSVTGVEGDGAAGSVATSASASAGVTGVAATGAAGSVFAVASTSIGVTGVSGSGAVGSVAPVAAASASVTGVGGTGAVGVVSALASAQAAPDGVSGTGAVGGVNATTALIAAPTGVYATSTVGDIGITVTSAIGVDGVVGSGTAGTVNASVIGSGAANPVGVVGTGQIGVLSPLMSGTVVPTGVFGMGGVGTPSAVVGQIATPEGVEATGAAGDVEAAVISQVIIGGVSGSGQVGPISGLLTGSVILDAVVAAGAAGTLTATTAPTSTPIRNFNASPRRAFRAAA